jgi:hypothetical protein
MTDSSNDMSAALTRQDEPVNFRVRIVERLISGKAISAFSVMVGISDKHELMPIEITDEYARVQTWDTAEELVHVLSEFPAQAKLCAKTPLDNVTGLVSRIQAKGSKTVKYCAYAEMRPRIKDMYWAEVSMDTNNVILHDNPHAAQAAASDIMDWLTSNSVDWTKTPITDTILGH